MSSPITTKVKNLSQVTLKYFMTKSRYVILKPGAEASINGDIFSLLTADKYAEVLVKNIMQGLVEVSYCIEKAYEVEKADTRIIPLTLGMADKYEEWLNPPTTDGQDKVTEEAASSPVDTVTDSTENDAQEQGENQEPAEQENPDVQSDAAQTELETADENAEAGDDKKDDPEEQDEPKEQEEQEMTAEDRVEETPKKKSSRKLKVQ